MTVRQHIEFSEYLNLIKTDFDPGRGFHKSPLNLKTKNFLPIAAQLNQFSPKSASEIPLKNI